MTAPCPLYLASSNLGKRREFHLAAAPWGYEVRILPGFDRIPPCIEDGTTFEENARKKALYYSASTSAMVFADDSGIRVDALGGDPGVLSARFAGPHATDAENNMRLLHELARRPGASRSAQYVCVIALAARRQLLGVFEGMVAGVIMDLPRGSGGFGYDPYFYYPPAGKTFAELTPDEKFEVSHRGVAFRKLLNFLALQNAAPRSPAPRLTG